MIFPWMWHLFTLCRKIICTWSIWDAFCPTLIASYSPQSKRNMEALAASRVILVGIDQLSNGNTNLAIHNASKYTEKYTTIYLQYISYHISTYSSVYLQVNSLQWARVNKSPTFYIKTTTWNQILEVSLHPPKTIQHQNIRYVSFRHLGHLKKMLVSFYHVCY